MDELVLAGCIIPDESGRILLIHRQTAKRKQWETPGGKVDNGESTESAAAREAKEEIGVDVSILKKLGEMEFEEDNFTLKYVWYLAEIVNGDPYLVEKEMYNGIKYFQWGELETIREGLSPNVINLLNEYLAGRINTSL